MADIRKIIAPDRATKQARLELFKQYAFYGVIAVILMIVLFIVPVLAGGLNAKDFAYYLPKSLPGWIVFWAIRGGTVAGNMCVYGLFKAQAKTNSKDNPNFIEANRLIDKQNGKKGFIPVSPKKKAVKDWTTKGIVVFITTALESVVIGSLILNWDLMTFLSCITSSITAVLFGIVAMIKDEVYWTEEYLLYAQYITNKAHESVKEPETEELPQEEVKENSNNVEVRKQGVQEPPRTSPRECEEYRDSQGEARS